jgi:hypothetical protein
MFARRLLILIAEDPAVDPGKRPSSAGWPDVASSQARDWILGWAVRLYFQHACKDDLISAVEKITGQKVRASCRAWTPSRTWPRRSSTSSPLVSNERLGFGFIFYGWGMDLARLERRAGGARAGLKAMGRVSSWGDSADLADFTEASREESGPCPELSQLPDEPLQRGEILDGY